MVNKNYLPALDCLRAIAILLVLIHHAGFKFDVASQDSIAEFVAGVGWVGVDLFFGISGFLVVGILISLKEPLGGFFVKRFFRIAPLYFVALFFYMVFSLLLGHDDVGRLWIASLFLTGWFVPVYGFDQMPYLVTWSLSVEEFAYVAFGLVSLIGRVGFARFLWGLIFMALVLRAALIFTGVFEIQEVYYFPLTRIDSLALGGLVAVYGLRVSWNSSKFFLLAVGTALVLVWFRFAGQYDFGLATVGYSVFGLISASWVAVLAGFDRISGPVLSLLSWVGRRSYFLYLFHGFVLALISMPQVASHLDFLGFWGNVFLVLGLTLICAEISWRFFEKPLIQYGRSVAAQL